MKMNKKIIIPFLSTVMGLSLIGGVSGAVAWYQFSTRATASFVATSAAESGILQICKKGSQQDYNDWAWGRDLIGSTSNGVDVLTGSTKENKLLPVTPNYNSAKAFGVDVSTFYSQPEAGVATPASWGQAVVNEGYLQFSVYLRAMKVSNASDTGYEQVKLPVFLKDITIEDFDNVVAPATPRTDLHASEAVRIHVQRSKFDSNGVESLEERFLISKNGGNTALAGQLDLDGDGADDIKGGYAWTENRNNVLTYGFVDNSNPLNPQAVTYSSSAIDDIIVDENATIGENVSKTTKDDYPERLLCYTEADRPVQLKFTIWLEGWTEIENSAIWNAYQTGCQIKIGMTFDIGKDAFKA